MLMYLRRGVLPPVAVSPVYTFGAPAVFCEGDCSCGIDGTGPARCSVASVRLSRSGSGLHCCRDPAIRQLLCGFLRSSTPFISPYHPQECAAVCIQLNSARLVMHRGASEPG